MTVLTTPERCETHGGRSLTACSHPALFAPLTETENETLFRQLGRSAGALGLVTSFLIADGQTAPGARCSTGPSRPGTTSTSCATT